MNEKLLALVKQAGGEFYPGFAGSPDSVKMYSKDLSEFVTLLLKAAAQKVRDTDLSDVDCGTYGALEIAADQIHNMFTEQ